MKETVTLTEEKLKKFETNEELILLVDDDPFVLKALEITLKREGYHVRTALSGEEALIMLQKEPFSLIICDLHMPNISGIEVLRQSQIIQPDTQRIILTALNETEAAIQSINVGQISQFILKPWEDQDLFRSIDRSLEKVRLTRQNQTMQALISTQNKQLEKRNEVLRYDLQLGARIHQTMLLGSSPAKVPGFSINYTTFPSKEIDGDFFEFFQPSGKLLDLVIGDVMGKGLPAALVGTAVKTQMLRFALPYAHAKVFNKKAFWQDEFLSPQEIVTKTHQAVIKQLFQLEYFVSIFYARFDLEKRLFTYVDCGSAKPIHYKAETEEIVSLSSANFPLGIDEKNIFEYQEVPFRKNDVFIFFSDGITEAKSPDNELFGYERLYNIVRNNIHLNSQELLYLIEQSVKQFIERDSFDDDLTLIVVKVDSCINPDKKENISANFYSDISQLKAVREFIEKVCRSAPGDSELLTNQLQLAINEIFCNIVKHGYKEKHGSILIEAEPLEEGIVLEVSDQGDFFDPSDLEEPNLSGDQENGFGWHIIRAIADEITYAPKVSGTGTNRLRIFKRYYLKRNNMELLHNTLGNVLIITPGSESLDAEGAREFKQKVLDLISSEDYINVVCDLKSLKYIDSSGLGSLLSILKLLHARGGDIKLANMSKPIRTIFELVSMHKIFEIHNTTEDAVKSFQARS